MVFEAFIRWKVNVLYLLLPPKKNDRTSSIKLLFNGFGGGDEIISLF